MGTPWHPHDGQDAMGLSPGQTSVSFLWPLPEVRDHNTGRGLIPIIVLTPGPPETHLELPQAFLGSRRAGHGRDAAPSSGQQGRSVDRTAGRPVLGWRLRHSLTGQEGMQHLHLSGIRTSGKPKEYKAVFFGATESSVHMAVAERLREPPPQVQGDRFLSPLFLKII
ncbi:PREDICTED: LOW QUALITY PROTEIN: putative uncharacterized protein C9orf62 homolog [Cercocebus atys]|uniref:LOW QUALITY PROTEIN: putative uncharacterized protein C9orf62 homolog n=1 Tax=Cercocebus atys TaxID=9531 RepID=UPI0005F376D2|nr:PREDICTED: LOW QUALITY PROTEIN: putative uncharacterized protein C9orf62 homolog [Cercocebus atys]